MFSISSLSLAAGAASLNDLEYMRRTVSKIILERERLFNSLKNAFPSQGNFLFIHTLESSSLVTIGTAEQNERFLKAYLESE